MIKFSKPIKEFIFQTLGESEGQKLIDAVRCGQTVILDGPHHATGKSTIKELLHGLGYDRVYVLDEDTKTIRAEVPVTVSPLPLRELLAPLGIESRY